MTVATSRAFGRTGGIATAVSLALALAFGVLWLIASRWRPSGISDYYFARQDLPVLFLMTLAALLLPHLRLGASWQGEVALTPRLAWASAAVLLAAIIFPMVESFSVVVFRKA